MKHYKLTAAFLTAAFLAGSLKAPAYAQNTTQKTAEATYEAAALLSESAGKCMDAAWEKCVNAIKENDYDYALTAASFDEKKQSMEQIDTYGLLASYMAAKKLIETNGRRAVRISDIPLVEFSYKEQAKEVYTPTKVEAYTLQNDGTYIKEGTHTILSAMEIAVYERTGDRYRDTGERREVTPDLKETVYADITLSYATPETLCEKMGVSFSQIEKEYTRRRELIEHKTNQETMTEMTAMKLPEYVDVSAYLEAADSITDDMRKAVVKIAINLLGQVPYEYGGKPVVPGYDTSWWTYDNEEEKQRGLDCSGFVKWAFLTAGKKDVLSSLTSTSTMKESGMRRVTLDELKPGDIGVTDHGGIEHCGIYLAPGRWIHCSSAAGTVTVSDRDIGFTVFFDPYTDTEAQIQDNDTDTYILSGESEAETSEEYTEPYDENANAREENDKDAEDAAEYQDNPAADETNDQTDTEKKEENDPESGQTNAPSVSENTVVPGEQGYDNGYDISESVDNGKRTYYTNKYNEKDIILLAKLIRHEAGGEGINGRIAVAEVVRNRLISAIYPDTIKEIVYQERQFPGASGLAKKKYTDEDLTVAKMVLSGSVSVLNNENVLYFRNPMTTDGISPETKKDWGKHTWYKAEGNHAFYIQ